MSSLTWNNLFLNGSIVDLTTGLWRARTKLKAADLGIENSQEVQKALSLGSHKLAPPKAFAEIKEAAARASRAIDYYSMNFGLIRGARYVPDTNLQPLMIELKGAQEEFNQASDAFVANYEVMKDQMLPVIRSALQSAAKDQESADMAYQRVYAEYPPSQLLRTKFALTWNIYSVQAAKSSAAKEVAEEESGKVKDILRDMIEQLRGDLQGKLQGILETATKGGTLPSRSVESAYKMLDRVESLNVLGDSVLADQVRAVRVALSGVDRKDVGDGFVTGLNDIQKTLEDSLEQAVADAERNLTGVGRRKLAVAEPEASVGA